MARLTPVRIQRSFFMVGVSEVCPPKALVQRNSASRIRPAARKRVLPVVMGGQNLTSTFTPVLLAPQRRTASARPEAMAPLLGFDCTRPDSNIKRAGSANLFYSGKTS